MSHLDPEVLERVAAGEATPPEAAHLEACATCRGRVRDARGRQRLLAGLARPTLSEVGFRRVEARLAEQVEAGLSPPWPAWLPWVVAAVASIGLVLLVVQGARPGSPSAGMVASTSPAPAARATFHPLTVLEASADARVRRGAGPWETVVAGGVLGAGDALSARSVVLAPAAAVPWAFRASGTLTVGGAAALALGAGQVLADVGAPVEVLVSTRRLVASDARFQVARAAAETVLDVARGEVEVWDSVTAERRVVRAPGRARWRDAVAGAHEEAPGEVPRLAVPARPWVPFDARGVPTGARISLDGATLGEAPFMRLVAAGRHRLSLEVPGQPARESWLELVGGRAFVLELPPREAAEVDGPVPDDEALARVMADLRRQRPRLAACYEKWLKANPTARGEVLLSLVVSARGRVVQASVAGDGIHRPSADCLVRTARALVLPALGAEATLEVPLLLKPPGR